MLKTPLALSKHEGKITGLAAYGKFSHSGMFTDEATLLELSSNKVKILRNPDLNPKITYPEDLVIAESIIMNRIQGKI